MIVFSILQSFAELKEEESSLIKEKIYLERVIFWSCFFVGICSDVMLDCYYIDIVLQEIATKNANFEVMRTTNESLKRMKVNSKFPVMWIVLIYFSEMSSLFDTYPNLLLSQLGFGSKSHTKPSSTSVELRGTVAGQPHQRIVSSEIHDTRNNTRPQASESRSNRIESTVESFFMIPDLNMMPSDDGMSWKQDSWNNITPKWNWWNHSQQCTGLLNRPIQSILKTPSNRNRWILLWMWNFSRCNASYQFLWRGTNGSGKGENFHG